MSSLRDLIACAAVAALCLGSLGCEKKTSQQAEEAKASVKVEPVGQAERAWAEQEVRRIWSDRAVAEKVKAHSPPPGRENFYHDLAVLTRYPHRLAGYGKRKEQGKFGPVFEDAPGSLFAGYYVENRLKAMGVEVVLTQEFPVAHAVTTECSLQVEGEQSEYGPEQGFYPMRPNLLQAPVTPEQGLTGKTLYVGGGTLEEYRDEPADRIVVMDFSAGDRWLDAFALGAKAVIFIGQSAPAPNTFHHLNFPANLPRFYLTAEAARKLGLRTRSRTVTIRAAAKWEVLKARNVVGVLRGTGPRFRLDGDEAVVLSAPLDSLSEVPLLSPGARNAANCAALLALAEYFQKNRPRRDVVLCFLDGDACNHAGARALYGSLYHRRKGAHRLAGSTLLERQEMFAAELEHIQDIQKVLALGNVFTDQARRLSSEGQRDAVLRMRDEAKGLVGPVRERLQPLRRSQRKLKELKDRLEQKRRRLRAVESQADEGERSRVKKELAAVEADLARAEADLKAINARLEPLEQDEKDWSNLQRALNDDRYPQPNPQDPPEKRRELERTQAKYKLLLARMQGLLRARREELNEALRQCRQSRALAEVIGNDRDVIVLHLAMNLGDASDRWTFIHGQDSQMVHASNDKLGHYAKIFQAIRNVAELPDVSAKLRRFEVRTAEGLFNVRMFAPGLFAHAGAVAGVFGVPNLALMTPMDRRIRDGQPCDVLDRPGPEGKPIEVLRVANTLGALEEIGPFLKALLDHEDMSLSSAISPKVTFTESTFSNGKYSGSSALLISAASAMPDRKARGAFATVLRRPGKVWEGARVDLVPPGFRPFCIARVQTSGRFDLPPLSETYYRSSLVVAAMFDSRGLIDYVNNQQTALVQVPLTSIQAVMFGTRPVTAVGFGHDRGAVATRALKAASTAPLRDDRSLVAESGRVLTIFARRGEAKRVKLFNPQGIVMLHNSPSAAPGQKVDPVVGVGWDLDPFVHWPTARYSAEDADTLNQARLDLLQRYDILPPSLWDLQAKARELLRTAERLEPAHVARRAGLEAASAAVSRRVYAPLVGVLNDLVVAVVLLLLLTIPFAYAMERLLVGTPHIYRQIGWFVVFFLATFVVLYLVNPAFRIAATPIVIFLAFGIILLSTLVIVIMTRKLQSEVRRMQGLGSTVHSSDVSRLGTMMAAVSMGISTMRRRPVRTLLTAVTVVLLTFTILTFASFTSSWGNRRTFKGPMSGPPRLLVRHPLWTRISEQIPRMLSGFLAEEADVVPRYWVSQTASEVQAYQAAGRTKEILVAGRGGRRIVRLSALVGVDGRDLRHMPALREILVGPTDSFRGNVIFLTSAMAGADGLDVKPGDAVNVDGVECRLGGFIDLTKITSYRLLEGSGMLPVDYQASGGGSAQALQQLEGRALEDLPEMESAQFITFSPDVVGIVPAELARRLGGRVASINIYPRQGVDLEKLADRVATVTGLPTYLGARGGVQRLFFTSLTEASGWRDLVIPVLLGGLIIFATMLGSVTDREKEIYAFSALGLAPPHVASLFFAEAGVYAVVGGMGGYLLGQAVARTLSYISQTLGILSVPTMNYSSTNAIVTVLIVMSTVLVSTIYPAVKASRSANPGIQRSWKIGKPAGDLYDLVFPFTVSAYDITGVVSFLKEHFDNFSDTALGVFATSSSRVFKQPNGMLGIRAEVALAPFDLGVSQRFALLAQPSEIEGIDEVRILLYRLSGTRGDWQRANRVFINELRKQLLIWRSITAEIMERYRQRTLQQWQELPVEDVTPQSIGADS